MRATVCLVERQVGRSRSAKAALARTARPENLFMRLVDLARRDFSSRGETGVDHILGKRALRPFGASKRLAQRRDWSYHFVPQRGKWRPDPQWASGDLTPSRFRAGTPPRPSATPRRHRSDLLPGTPDARPHGDAACTAGGATGRCGG